LNMPPLPTILERIVAAKRDEIAEQRAAIPASELLSAIETMPAPGDFVAALARKPDEPIRLIAEFKRASPSKGAIRDDLTPADVARRYEMAGASAMSVLTDGPFFSGSLDDLREARAAADIPILRKDFILDRYQILQARAAGADAALLIAAALPDAALRELLGVAEDLGLAALIEVHNEEELQRALAVEPHVVGINNRNLHTFDVALETTLALRPRIPECVIVVSESGIRSRDDALRLQDAGVDAMLVGERLMRQPDPGRAARELLGSAAPGHP